jgi:hypothetical protein
MTGITVTLVPDEVVVARYAAILSRPAFRDLEVRRERWPRAYSRRRYMEEADAILDTALDVAAATVAQYPADEPAKPAECIVCDGLGCEFCPKVA